MKVLEKTDSEMNRMHSEKMEEQRTQRVALEKKDAERDELREEMARVQREAHEWKDALDRQMNLLREVICEKDEIISILEKEIELQDKMQYVENA